MVECDNTGKPEPGLGFYVCVPCLEKLGELLARGQAPQFGALLSHLNASGSTLLPTMATACHLLRELPPR